jgi:hypothetical protein
LEQIGLMEMNPVFELKAGGICAGDFECGRRNVGSVDF